MGLPLIYVAIVALPIFLRAAWTDYKTKLLDTRPLYALIGLSYGGYFANGISILFAAGISIALILLQWANTKAKLRPLGAGDFPLLQAFTLILFLFSPGLIVFVIFMLALLIFLGLWSWFFKDRSFAPAIAFTFFLFGLTKLIYI